MTVTQCTTFFYKSYWYPSSPVDTRYTPSIIDLYLIFPCWSGSLHCPSIHHIRGDQRFHGDNLNWIDIGIFYFLVEKIMVLINESDKSFFFKWLNYWICAQKMGKWSSETLGNWSISLYFICRKDQTSPKAKRKNK